MHSQRAESSESRESRELRGGSRAQRADKRIKEQINRVLDHRGEQTGSRVERGQNCELRAERRKESAERLQQFLWSSMEQLGWRMESRMEMQMENNVDF
jgi:demethoxyubiquinone hydroxylase (CLK1/Coq7/Cat5 family)